MEIQLNKSKSQEVVDSALNFIEKEQGEDILCLQESGRSLRETFSSGRLVQLTPSSTRTHRTSFEDVPFASRRGQDLGGIPEILRQLSSDEDTSVDSEALKAVQLQLICQLSVLVQRLETSIKDTSFATPELNALFGQVFSLVQQLAELFPNTRTPSIVPLSGKFFDADEVTDEAKCEHVSRSTITKEKRTPVKKLDSLNTLMFKRFKLSKGMRQPSRLDSKLHLVGMMHHLNSNHEVVSPFWEKLRNQLLKAEDPEVRVSELQQQMDDLLKHASVADDDARHSGITTAMSNGGQRPIKNRRRSGSLATIKNEECKIKSKWIISPNNSVKHYFDFLVALLVIFSICTIPIQLAFNALDTNQFASVEYVIDAIFLVDVALTFSTAVIDGTHTVYCRRTIAVRYLKGMFMADLLSSLPYNAIVSSALGSAGNASMRMVRGIRILRVLRILRLLKFMRIFRVVSTLQGLDVASAFQVDPAVTSLVMRMCLILFFAHLMACLWYYINACAHEEDDWVRCGHSGDLGSSYLASLYFIIQTMMTVGYGDVAVNTDAQRAFAMMIQITGTLCVGIIVSSIEELVDSFDTHAKYLSERMNSLKLYMSEKKLPATLKKKLKRHFIYLHSRTSVFPEQAIIHSLPQSVFMDLIKFRHAKDVKKLNFFTCCYEAGHTDFVFTALPLLKPMLCQSDEVILLQDDPPEDIYFVRKGRINSFLRRKHDILLGVFRQGSTLNLSNAICYREMHCTLRAACVSDMLWMHMEDLEMMLKMFPFVGQFVTDVVKVEINKIAEVIASSTIQLDHLFVKEKILFEPNNPMETKVYSSTEVLRDPTFAVMKRKSPSEGMKKRIRTLRFVNITIKDAKKLSSAELKRISLSEDALFNYHLVEAEETKASLKQNLLVIPDGKFKKKWDFFIFLLTAWSMVSIPFRIGFAVESTGFIDVDIVVDCFYLLDILVTFRTLHEATPGLYFADPKAIALRYLSTWFLIDLVSAFPTNAFEAMQNHKNIRTTRLVRVLRFLRFFKLLRVFKLSWILKNVSIQYEAGEYSYYLKQLLLLATLLLYVGHFFGCYWSFIAHEEGVEVSWMADVPAAQFGNLTIANANLVNQYTTSIYWAFTTITTVGYGDIKPVNDTERGYAVAVMVAGAALFAFIVGNVSHLVGQLSILKQMNKKQASEINEYALEQQLEFALSNSIKKHVHFAFSMQTASIETGILRRLPSSLRRETLWHSSQQIRTTIPIFSSCSQSFISIILQKTNQEFSEAGSEIYSPANGSKGLYFLIQGKVEETKYAYNNNRRPSMFSVISEKHDVVNTIEAGGIFGQRSYLELFPQYWGARASPLHDCYMYVLYTQDLNYLQEKYHDVSETLTKCLKNWFSREHVASS